MSADGKAAVSTKDAAATMLCVSISGSMNAYVVVGRRATLKERKGMKLELNFMV